MRRLYFLFIALLSISAAAQTTQSGYVQEYNEKAKKTPLSGVELRVRSANSTVSDETGQFSLQFLTLKPGEKVNVRRIEKLGYEIFNKEAVEQWNINPQNPFIIVMCRSDKFKAIRDNYEKVSSASYARQLEKEQAELKALKAQGKIKEAEYQKQLSEIQENYDKQLDNLGNYIDRFARIDISELSAVEQEIIELVQQGRIEQAIAKYEQQNYLDKYKQEVAQLKEVSTAIDQLTEIKTSKEQSRDSILAAIDRQIETLRLAGGKENFDKIGVIMHDLYNVDTANTTSMEKYADYLFEIKQISQANPIYLRLISSNKYINDKLLHYYNRVSLIENDLDNYANALNFSMEAEKIYKDNSNYFSLNEIVRILFNRGTIYYRQHEINSAKQYFEEAIKIGEYQKSDPLLLATAKNSLANIYSSEHKHADALKLYNDIYHLYLDLKDNSPKSNERISGILLNLAQLYNEVKNFDLAIDCITKSITYIEKCYDYNPSAYIGKYTDILNTAGNIYSDTKRFEIAEEFYDKAIALSLSKYNENPILFWRNHFNLLGNKAILQTQTRQYDNAVGTFEQALSIIKNAPESNFRTRFLGETLYNLSYIYCVTDRYNDAIPLLSESLQYAEQLFTYNKRYGANMYLNSLNNIAYCYDMTGYFVKAKELYYKALEIIEDLDLLEVAPFNYKYATYTYNIGQHIHYKENSYTEAIPLYLKAYELYVRSESISDILETSVGLADCYLKTGQIEEANKWIYKPGNIDIRESNHIGWLNVRGLIALKNGDNEKVLQCKKRILEVDPNAPVAEVELFNMSKDL